MTDRSGSAASSGKIAWDATRGGVCALPIHVVEPPSWEPIEGEDAIRLEMREWDRPSVLRDRVVPILEGIEAGEDLPEIVDRVEAAGTYRSRKAAERGARTIVLGLAGQGNLEIELPPVPEVFGGRFERVEELGRGSVGVAWLARDLETGEQVVVKHAWNWNGSLERRDRNLREEAELMARFDHPGIVEFVDGLEVDGRFHLVREFVDGHELADRLLTEGPLPQAGRSEVAYQVAEILDHLHDRSVLCMDLKPANLMRREDGGSVVLADLGHCRAVEDPPVALERVPGTVGYLGPEIFEEQQAGPRSDVYGFGKLYEFMVTAYPPNQGEPIEEVLERMRERGDPSEHELGFVEACLAEDPSRRPASAGEAVERLDA